MVLFLYYIKFILEKKLKFQNVNKYFEKIVIWYYQIFPSKKIGIDVKKKEERKIIISLTTIPKRIDSVWITIESLLRQNYKPDKIILWLAENEFTGVELPEKLQRQIKRGISIRFCEDLKSYKKFYFAMREYPDSYVVTVDDDMIYAENMLKKMLKEYKYHKRCVIGNRCHLIRKKDGEILPYKRWMQYENRFKYNSEPQYANFFTGCGGVLFPVFLLDKRIFQKDVFMMIAPTADDVWLNFICWVSGVKIKNTKGILGYLIYIEETYRNGLARENVIKRKNDMQIKAVMEYLNINIDDYL